MRTSNQRETQEAVASLDSDEAAKDTTVSGVDVAATHEETGAPPADHRAGLRLPGCGKFCYPSKPDAERGLRRMLRSNGQKSAVHPYFCPDCRWWHVGHTSHKHSEGVKQRKRAHALRKRDDGRFRDR